MRRQVEVRWSRRLQGGRREESIQVRRDGGGWESVACEEELPADIQELLRLAEAGREGTSHPVRGIFRRHRGPSQTQVREPSGEDLEIVTQWRNGVVILCVIAVAGISFAAWRALQDASGVSQAAGVALAALAVVLFYYGLAVYVNRTVFTIRHGRLTIRHVPLPWLGNRDLPADRIEQLYVRFRRGSKGGGHYELCAHVDGWPVRLYEQGRNREEVVSIERAIERHLGIEDWPGWNAP